MELTEKNIWKCIVTFIGKYKFARNTEMLDRLDRMRFDVKIDNGSDNAYAVIIDSGVLSTAASSLTLVNNGYDEILSRIKYQDTL